MKTRTGHGFSDEAATRKMYQEFAAAEVEHRHRLVDPPDQPEAVADLVAAAWASDALLYRQPNT